MLNQATGEPLPADRKACLTWWYRQHGRTYVPPSEGPRPTLTRFEPLEYQPRDVSGLGFHPLQGYFLLVPAGW